MHNARVIIVTIPDPPSARLIIHQCRSVAPNATVVARARYHVRQGDLYMAGADEVVDEESEVGMRLAATARRYVRTEQEIGKSGD
jgi:voltage-gated potassium channel Kch